MAVTALVMAGGKGTRMTASVEKPLLPVGGKPVIMYVLAAARDAKKVDSIIVAVSSHTPKTSKLMQKSSVAVIDTPGKEYVSDLAYAVKTLKLENVLAIGADLPLITGEILDAILDRYERCGKPALTVAVPKETKQRLGLSSEYIFSIGNKLVVPVGINVIDGSEIGREQLDQEVYVLDDEKVAINVNTLHELNIAENLVSKIQRGNSSNKKPTESTSKNSAEDMSNS